MGLAISRSIIEAHGGRLWPAANGDRGTTLHFTVRTGGESARMTSGGVPLSKPHITARRAAATVLSYGLAVLFITAGLSVTLLLRPETLIAPVFFLAIILSAWFGGIGPGLVSALLATLAVAYFFLQPVHSLQFDHVEALPLLAFFLSAVLVSSWSAPENARRHCSGKRVMSWRPRLKSGPQTSNTLLSSHARACKPKLRSDAPMENKTRPCCSLETMALGLI
jgi:K+-sensing histidine kinase KdpD